MYVSEWINHVLFIITIGINIGYLYRLFLAIRKVNNREKNPICSHSHILHFWAFVFVSPFLISIAYATNSMALTMVHDIFGEKSAIGYSRFLFYLPIIISVYVFIWAFCRSIFIISYLDMGYWANSPLFCIAMGASGKRSRNIETALRSAIIIAFLEHHIVVAEIVGAPIQQFYGMSPLCQTGMGGAIPASISQLPLICGAYNTAAFTLSGLLGNFGSVFTGPQVTFGKDYIHESITLLTVSATMVCAAIFVWSLYVGTQYEKYMSNLRKLPSAARSEIKIAATLTDLKRSRKKLYIQRWCVLFTGLCAIYMFFISHLRDISIDGAVVLSVGIVVPVISATYVLYTVIAQITYDRPLFFFIHSKKNQNVTLAVEIGDQI